MIKHLTGRATFNSTGATIVVDFQPKTGITAVVGPNGSGKTFTASESLRYLLFGSAALRGKMADYSELTMGGVVTIRGRDYTIARTAKAQFIDELDTQQRLAVGADAVNKKVVELLGYPLDVFDVCNSAMQGDTALFGKMRSSERKAMVDKILGVVDVKAAEKACADEATMLRREVEAMLKTLRTPGDEPVYPVGYRQSETVRERLLELRLTRESHEKLSSRLHTLEEPVRPSVGKFDEDEIARLQLAEDARRRLVDRRQDLERIAFDNSSRVDLDKAQARLDERNARFARGLPPTIPLQDIADDWKRHHKFDAYTSSDEVTCPKCNHTFRPTGEPPEAPKWPKNILRTEEARWERWKDQDWNAPLPDGEDLTLDQIQRARRGAEAAAALAAMELPGEDRSEELNQMRSDQARMNAFLEEQRRYEFRRQANAEIEAELEKLGPVPSSEELDKLSEEYHVALAYERDKKRWDEETKSFTEAMVDIDGKRELSEEFKRGRDGLADARATLKAYLAPTLSRVASKLIFDMTNGKLTSITVDEDMNIVVDRQRIETLSGAGATVANIALRVALGQILVGKAFPVFIGDEMDGDLDYERRQATIQAMVSLKEHLNQIVLITHRGVDVADHVIDLGDHS